MIVTILGESGSEALISTHCTARYVEDLSSNKALITSCRLSVQDMNSVVVQLPVMLMNHVRRDHALSVLSIRLDSGRVDERKTAGRH